MAEPLVELSRPGCESLDFKLTDINPSTVANAFRLDPQSVWLKQEFGRRCYFPDHNGEFNFDHEVGDRVLSLIVEGTPVIQANHTVPCATVATTSNTAGHNQPYYKPIASKKDTTFNVKVVKAKMSKLHNGKVEFEKLEQTHVSLDDRTANVNTVTCAIQSKWGSEYIVVTGDGLEVDDSSGTQGKFWRVPTRKFYAIQRPESQRKGKGKKRKQSHIVIDSSSDTDDFLPSIDMSKKIRRSLPSDGASCSEMTTIKDEIQAIRQDMQCLFQIDKRMKIPTALYQKLSETFKCNICHRAPIAPPVIFARCCKAIVGCQTCVDTWFMGDEGISKKCPLCGTDRALPDTMRLHGLDDFLLAIKPILVDPQNEHDNM